MNTPYCGFTARLLFDFPADGQAIRVVTQAHQCQDYDQFPSAKMTFIHFFTYGEEIVFAQVTAC
jgi:hypothetical protein